MKLNLHKRNAPLSAVARRRRNAHSPGIALIITLLMLAAITFLAIAFLAMTRRDRAAATAGVDLNVSKEMSDAAFARAQAEIIARMMAQNDLLSYDYMASHNFINPNGFTNDKIPSINNVNYDFIAGTTIPMTPTSQNGAPWAQNIANLYYDPRPPVFVTTNGPNGATGNDFRFWVDLNQNGHFEGTGWVTNVNDGVTNGIVWNNNGEPEWIGVLRDPLFPHSATNPFVGRYAYMVLPIGKTLDLNFIHNYSKSLGDGVPSLDSVTSPSTFPNNVALGNWHDGFSRDQGVGSWELNLAALLLNLNTNIYLNELSPANQYDYIVPPQSQLTEESANEGLCFNDAWSMVYYRYGAPSWSPAPLDTLFSNYTQQFATDGIDESGAAASLNPANQFTLAADPDTPARAGSILDAWPVGYNTNMYYDIEDVLNSNKNSQPFVNRMIQTMMTNDTYDQNTFQRLLATIGTGSSPEDGVYVYTNITNLVPGVLPTWLRAKVNINYDNTYQITNINAPFVPASSNLVSWAPLAFFTNAADLLLRSQEYPFTVTNNAGFVTATYYNHFGVTNIPIYNSTNSSVYYSAQIHRMLQLAANIYDAAAYTNGNLDGTVSTPLGPRLIRYPHVYRPVFSAAGTIGGPYTVSIIGYTDVGAGSLWQLALRDGPFYALSDSANILNNISQINAGLANIWGVPWIVGAVPQLPSFNRVSDSSYITVSRDLLFIRHGTKTAPNASLPPQYTNQFYVMTITNLLGMDAWNPSRTNFNLSYNMWVSNFVTIEVTNNAPPPNNYAFTNNFSMLFNPPTRSVWTNSTFIPFFQTNITTLQIGYYSTAWHVYTNFAAIAAEETQLTPTFTPADLAQTSHPEFDWSIMITNRVVYALGDNQNNLFDFVNLGPFGTSNNITAQITNAAAAPGLPQTRNFWAWGTANSTSTSPLSQGAVNEIIQAMDNSTPFYDDMNGIPTKDSNKFWFGPGFYPNIYYPTAVVTNTAEWAINDPLVHYTVDDLTWPGHLGGTSTPNEYQNNQTLQYQPVTNDVGTVVSPRYTPWGSANSLPEGQDNPPKWAFEDALITNSDAWQFPTNKFPGIGWLGRVHRGTPWQTVYLKAFVMNTNDWANDTSGWVNSPYTAPATDWPLVDLFTATPNDNAARGLLSVNQTNDAAWAAVFAGVIVSNAVSNQWVAINPTSDITNLMDGPGGINTIRANYLNGNFHHIGDILGAFALTANTNNTTDLGLTFNGVSASDVPDYVTERIPQQTLSLLKLGMPQFAIYAWGQSLRPKQLYLAAAANQNICTNYEITGEFLARIVCHVVNGPVASTDLTNSPAYLRLGNGVNVATPKIVVDSYNIEPGN